MSETDTGAGDAGPFAEQRRLFTLLSQDTRHLIIQELLGHPAHLMSLAELEYMTGKSQAAIKDQLET
ncbi:ArsR family transcriptional regulator, partial [Halorubrum sp. Atlit-26R]